MRRFSIALLGALACGGDDETGPTSTDVTGTWSASLANMSGDGANCSSTAPTQLVLNQTGATISGSYSGGELFCTAPGSTGAVPIGTGSILNGTLSGTSLSFDLDTPDFHHEGTVSGTSMSGTAEWTMDFGIPAGVVTLSGNWTAAKQ